MPSQAGQLAASQAPPEPPEPPVLLDHPEPPGTVDKRTRATQRRGRLYRADLAARGIQRSRISQASLLATVGRIAVIVPSGAMALRQMGLANEVIELTFGPTLGAVAGCHHLRSRRQGSAVATIGDLGQRLRGRMRSGSGSGEHHAAE